MKNVKSGVVQVISNAVLGVVFGSALIGGLAGCSVQSQVHAHDATAAATKSATTPTPTPNKPIDAMSTLSVSSPSLTSGDNISVTVQVKDVAGKNVTQGGAKVFINWSGGGNATFTPAGPVAAVDNGNGTYTANFSSVLAGNQKFSATVGEFVVASTATVAVAAGRAAHLAFSTQPGGGVAGAAWSQPAVVQIQDANGNVIADGADSSSSVTVSLSFGSGVLAGTLTQVAVGGVAQFTDLNINLSGTTKILSAAATIHGVPVTATSNAFTVAAGPISLTNSVLSSSLMSVASGNSVTLTLQAKDAVGNLITTGGETVSFAGSGGSATFTSAIPVSATDNHDGTYSASLTGVIVGSQIFTAMVGGSAVVGSKPVTVIPGPMSPLQSTVSVNTNSVAVGSRVTVTIQAIDAAGNFLTAGGSAVTVAWGAGASTFSPAGPVTATYLGNGVYGASFAGQTSGAASTFSVKVAGVSLAATQSITVTASAAALIASVGTTLHGSGLTGQRHMFFDPITGNWWLFYLDSADPANIKTIYSDGNVWQAGPNVALPAGSPHRSEGSQIALDYRELAGNGIVYIGYTYDGSGNSVTEYIRRVQISGANFTPNSWVVVSGPLNLSGGTLPSLAHSISILESGTVALMSSAIQSNGNFYATASTTKDDGVTGITAFNASSIMAVVNNWARHSALFPMGGDTALSIADDVGPADNYSDNFYAGSFLNGAWTPSLPNENAVSTNYVMATPISQIQYEDWAGLRVTNSEAELVTRDGYAGGFKHMRFNGSAWNTGDAIPALVGVQGTGLALTSDGTDAWLFAIAGDAAHSIQYVKWTQGTGWDASWTIFEGSTAVRQSLTTTEVADSYGFFQVTWTEAGGRIVSKPFH